MLEKMLGMLAGDEDGTRVQIVQVGEPGEVPTVEFRTQRECGDLGWATQRRVRLAPGQWSELRDALNMMDIDARQATRASSIEEKRPAHGLRLIG